MIMTDKDYKRKKQECLLDFCIEHDFYITPEVEGIFGYAFDRAYALDKQEIKQETDAEGEEMLTVSRKKIQKVYRQNKEEINRENVSSSDKDCYETVNEVLKTLFGSKCLPDEACNIASNVASSKPYVDSSEPKPAEPTCTDDVPTCTDDCSSQCSSQDFDTIIKDGFSKERRLNIAAMMMQGMLSNTTRFSSYEISDLVRISLNCADALIAEVEKGGLQ